jgi:single-strand DNA-binding protein
MYQKVLIIGNLGRDPEMRYLPNGTAVTNMNVASNRNFTRGDGTRETDTTWFRVSVWGKQAEACNEHLVSGRRIYIEGQLISDDSGNPKIFTRNDGTAGASFEVRAQQVIFLGSPSDNGGGASSTTAAETAAEAVAPAHQEEDEEIPF